jgi:hypothetical protein
VEIRFLENSSKEFGVEVNAGERKYILMSHA